MIVSPIPHLVIDDFLAQAEIERLLDFAGCAQARFVPAGVYSKDASASVDEARRRSLQLAEPGAWKEPLARSIDRILDETTHALGMARLPPGKKEIQIVWNGDGGFFARHRDAKIGRPDATNARALTFVYYFHASPKQFEGGQLRLHAARRIVGAGPLDIEPRCNRLVAFPSVLPHEVLPTRVASQAFMDGRFSINCWIHRPLGEDARSRNGG